MQECRICFCSCPDHQIIKLTCNHQYCGICIAIWNTKNHQCPTCRQRFVLPPRMFVKEPLLVFLEFSQQMKRKMCSALDIFDDFWNTVNRFLDLKKHSKRQRKKLKTLILKEHENCFSKLSGYRHILDTCRSGDYRLTEMADFSMLLFSLLLNGQMESTLESIETLCFLFLQYFSKMTYHFGHNYEEHYQLYYHERNQLRKLLK
jgi:hypothetical protein